MKWTPTSVSIVEAWIDVMILILSTGVNFIPFTRKWKEKKEKLGTYAIKHVAAGAHLLTHRFFVPASGSWDNRPKLVVIMRSNCKFVLIPTVSSCQWSVSVHGHCCIAPRFERILTDFRPQIFANESRPTISKTCTWIYVTCLFVWQEFRAKSLVICREYYGYLLRF